MQKRSSSELEKYVKDNLSKGFSKLQIRSSLISNGYSQEGATKIVALYSPKIRNLNNNIIAIFVIAFLLISAIGNFFIIGSLTVQDITGAYSTTGSGTASMCINTQPTIDISGCATETNVTSSYSCAIIGGDDNSAYTTMNLSYYDNSSLFNITKVNETYATLNFTTSYPSDSGGNQSVGKNYSIELKIGDNSSCTNENNTQFFNFYVQKGCSVKVPPTYFNLSTNYSISKNVQLLLQLNATDADFEDGVNYSVTLINTSAFAALNSTCSDVITLDVTNNILNVSPNIVHVGHHMLNISSTDNSSCTDDTVHKLVNISVDTTNNAPAYVGQPLALDFTWDEDTTVFNVYNLDDFFNDTDSDCLKYEVEYIATTPHLNVQIDNNYDPRCQACLSHFVTLSSDPNWFGTESVYIYANDTINISEKIFVEFVVTNVAEVVTIPGGGAGGGGGGGGGGSFKLLRCEERWYCDNWGECADGFSYRECSELNQCLTTKFKPNETQICDYIAHCYNEEQDFAEEGVDCGGECVNQCITCYDAILNCHVQEDGSELCEEGIDCGGPCGPCGSCSDGIKNQNEEGVDCGGSCVSCIQSNILYAGFDGTQWRLHINDYLTNDNEIILSGLSSIPYSVWSPDGLTLATIMDNNIWEIDPFTKRSVQLSPDSQFYRSYAAWSYDGKLIAFTEEVDGKPILKIFDIASGEIREIYFDVSLYYPDLLFDSSQIAVSTKEFSFEGYEIEGLDNKITGYYVLKEYAEILILDDEGEIIRKISDTTMDLYAPEFSPDGTKILYFSEIDGQSDIWIYDLETGIKTRLTDTPENELFPKWSRDIQKVVFTANYDGTYDIYSTDLDGENLQKTGSQDTFNIPMDWFLSPSCYDGKLNQDEEEIDCGGICDSCEKLAPIEFNYGISLVVGLIFIILLALFLLKLKKKSKKKSLKAEPSQKGTFLSYIRGKIRKVKHKKIKEAKPKTGTRRKDRSKVYRKGLLSKLLNPKKKKEPEPTARKKQQKIIQKKKSNWISNLKDQVKSKVKIEDIVPVNYGKLIKDLDRSIGHVPNETITRTLGRIMRDWLKDKYDIDYGESYEVEKLRLGIRDKVKIFFDLLIETEYSGEKVSEGSLKSLLRQAYIIVGEKKSQTKSKVGIKASKVVLPKIKVHGKRKKRRKTYAILVLMVLLMGGLYIYGPEITGRLIFQGEETIEIDTTFTFDNIINLDIPDDILSLKLTGSMDSNTVARAYYGSNKEFLVYDTSSIAEQALHIRTDEVQSFIGEEKGIDVKLEYNKGTPWDSDDDGDTSVDDAVDLTVQNSLFNGQIEEENLCTLWAAENSEGAVYSCYGSSECCTLLELTPERDTWDDTYYLTTDKIDQNDYYTVSAKIVYASYSLDTENPYSEIIESESEDISANFISTSIAFNEVCVDTCDINVNNVDNKLIFEIDSGSLYIDEVKYLVNREVTLSSPPEFNTVPNIEVNIDGSATIDLNEYVSDADSENLNFGYRALDDLDISIVNGIATIAPNKGFSGSVFTFFTVNDSESSSISNLITIEVKEIVDATVSGEIRIGQPVKWTKKVKLNKTSVQDLEVDLEHDPISISVTTISVSGTGVEIQEEIPEPDLLVNDEGTIKTVIEFEDERILEIEEDSADITPSEVDSGSFSLITGRAVLDPISDQNSDPNSENTIADVSVIIDETVISEELIEAIEVEYLTEAPTATEEETNIGKRIVVSSDVHYENIIAFTTIPDSPIDTIKLYHVVDDSRETIEFESYDSNENGLVDYIEWIVPSLSNQTYEVEITVLNIQSYPTVGGEWEVRFNTTGLANLTISAINDTTYGFDTPDDLTPLELRCGDQELEINWSQGNSITYNNYECNETGYWTVAVLTEGVHNQMFEFGGSTAYANNLATANKSGSNLTIWDSTDSGTWYSTNNIVFYANYTNGTSIANGTCTIKLNLTGTWTNHTNMTYNGVGLPYNYSATIPYKGTTYYNVLCSNSTMATLNATDEISITNSEPILNTTGGFLPKVICTEDVSCSYNISAQVTEVDLNDVLSYDYTTGSTLNMTNHADCNNCWNFDFTNGNLTVVVTTSAHANQSPWYPELTVTDSSDASDIGTLNVSVIAVNDFPVITVPAGTTLTTTTTNANYTYQMAATDEEDPSITFFNFSFISCVRPNYVNTSSCNESSININVTTGLFNFTTVNADAGNYTLNLSVRDNLDANTHKLVNFTITDINDPPVLTFICNATRGAVEDTLLSCTINATDPDASDVLTFAINNSIFITSTISNTEVIMNFTPINSEVGNYSLNVSVQDPSSLSDYIIINFTINNTNDPPWFYNISDQVAIVGLEYRYNASAYDDDFFQPLNTFTIGNENISFGINQSFINISKFNETAALINFTPVLGNVGNYSVKINVTDVANASFNLSFNLSIRNNSAPILDFICNNSRIIQEEILHICFVNASDAESDNYTFSVNASWFLINATTGNVSFTVNDSRVGSHDINFSVTDYWGAAGSQIINFTVNNTPEAPSIVLANLTFTESVTTAFNLSQNVSDEDQNTPNGDTIYFYSNASFNGPYVLNVTTGILNFTPAFNDVGSFRVNITVNDSYNLLDSIIINFTVININDRPTFDYVCDNERTAVEDLLFNCTINATDLDGDTLSFSTNSSWFNLSAISNGNVLANFTPSNDQVGNHTINITVSDGSLNSTTSINFTVNNTNDPPAITLGNLNSTEDSAFNHTVNGTDVDLDVPAGEVLTFGTNSTLFTINSSSGFFNFTPNASDVGNYSIKFNVTDLNGSVAIQIINFSVIWFNDPPVLDTIPNFQQEEGIAFYYDVNTTDEEDGNDSSGSFTYAWNHTLNWFGLNSTSGVINFTANTTMVGNHSLNISVTDSSGKVDYQLFNLSIVSLNFAPNITTIRPYGTPKSTATVFGYANRSEFPNNVTSVTILENTSIIFNLTVTDANSGDTLTSKWYENGTLNLTTTNPAFTYYAGFNKAGRQNITVFVDDGRGKNDTFSWNVTVNNTNRHPIFGMREQTPDQFTDGTDNNTNTTSGGIKFAANGSVNYNYAEFISSSIDIGALSSAFYNPIGFTTIEWDATTASGTNVTVQTRTSSNNVNWNNWSIDAINRSYSNSSGERIVSENATFIQYKLILQTNDTSLTPNVTNVRVNHVLPDLVVEQGDTNPNWLELEDFFRELDTDDTLSYSVNNGSKVTVTISDSSPHLVGITAPTDFSGVEDIFFTANDSEKSITSNNITITINATTTASAVEFITVSSTSTVIRTRTRTITEPRFLEVLSPQHITAFNEDTVVAPIILRNNGEAILNDITLSASNDRDDVNVWFSNNKFGTLGPGASAESELFMQWEGTIDEFDVIINVTSTDPPYSDSAIISVTGVARVEHNRSLVQDNIEFVRDLLNNNPECLELTELLSKASDQMASGQDQLARVTLNFLIDGCRYLITTQKDIEQPTPIDLRSDDLYRLISGLLLLLLFIATIIIIALARRKPK